MAATPASLAMVRTPVPPRTLASAALIAGIATGPIAGTATQTGVLGTPLTTASAAAPAPAAPSTQDLMPHGVPGDQSTPQLDDEQKANAAAIVKATQDMHLPPRAAVSP